MATPFISEQDVSDLIGRNVTADAGATMAVDSACEMVRTLTEQTLDAVTGGTAILDGTGTDSIVLPELPVSAAGTVLVNGTAITDYELNDNGVLIRGTAGARPWHPYPNVWPEGRQNITVTYDHGYSSVPEDLRMVAVQLASRMILQGPAKSESVGQDSVTYAVAATDLTPGEMRIIRKYRREH